MYKLQRGFTPIQIAFSIFAGVVIIGGVIGGILYFSKPELESKIGKCGDGICGVIEKDKNICPQDCVASSQTGSEQEKISSEQQSGIIQGKNPLQVFFVMHVEPGKIGEGEDFQLSSRTYNRVKEVTLKVADILEKHGMRGNFEIVYRISTDALAYEGSNSFIKQLKDRGHLIALHSHHWMLMQSESQCQQLCGDKCLSTGSSLSVEQKKEGCLVRYGGIEDGLEALKKLGFNDISVMAFRSFTKTETENKTYEFSRAENLGAKIVNDNYSPLDKMAFWSKECSDFGNGDNNWYAETGNFLHPWRPDYAHGNLCGNNKNGKILYIDQVTGDWFASGNYKTLTEENFDVLRKYYKNALNHLSADQLNVWGWPQHEVEYLSQDSKGIFSGSYNQDALDALDDFLGELDQYKKDGKIKYSTLEDIYNEYVEWESGK